MVTIFSVPIFIGFMVVAIYCFMYIIIENTIFVSRDY